MVSKVNDNEFKQQSRIAGDIMQTRTHKHT